MTHEDFILAVQEQHLRDRRILERKRTEYTPSLLSNRFDQFVRAAAMKRESPAQAAGGMAIKHFTAVFDIISEPAKFDEKKIKERFSDARNYLHIIESLILEED